MHPSYARLLDFARRATSDLPPAQQIHRDGDLAARLGQSPQTVSNWKKRGVSIEGAAAAEKAFGVSVSYVLEGANPTVALYRKPLNTGGRSGLVAHEMSVPGEYSVLASRVNAPVHRTARVAASGELRVADTHQEGTVATAGVSADAFAVRVEGDELFPTLRHGMFVICDPAAECVQGEWVLVEKTDGTSHLLELLIQREAEIVTASLSGGHRQTFARSELRRVVAVTGTAFASRFKPRG